MDDEKAHFLFQNQLDLSLFCRQCCASLNGVVQQVGEEDGQIHV